MHNILFSLWFFLPGGIANASPVFVSRISFLKWLYIPLDFGKKFRKRRIFGDNKTWLGILFAISTAFVVIAFQKYGYDHSQWLRTVSGAVDYSQPIIWWLGPLLGLGALLGDALESFFKRQIGIKPGHSWFPFDQIDYILGGLLLSLLVIK